MNLDRWIEILAIVINAIACVMNLLAFNRYMKKRKHLDKREIELDEQRSRLESVGVFQNRLYGAFNKIQDEKDREGRQVPFP